MRFKPKGLIALQGMADLLEISSPKFAEEILLRMLNMAVNSDAELKRLWDCSSHQGRPKTPEFPVTFKI